MKHIPLLQGLSLPFIGAVVTLAPVSVKEEPLGYIVLMCLITILRILPYRVSRGVGLVSGSLAYDLGMRINKQKKGETYLASPFYYISDS